MSGNDAGLASDAIVLCVARNPMYTVRCIWVTIPVLAVPVYQVATRDQSLCRGALFVMDMADITVVYVGDVNDNQQKGQSNDP